MTGWFVSIGLALALQVPPPRSSVEASAGLRQEQRAIRDHEVERLQQLAVRLIDQGQNDGASAALAVIEPRSSADGATRFVPLPELSPARGKGLADVPAGQRAAAPWRSELETIRAEAAKALFDLALRSASTEPRHYALAGELLRAVIVRQPDHPEARRLLGYVAHEGGWATPFAVRKLREGYVRHATFGWVPSSWVSHLERGELPAPTEPRQKQVRWLPADQADELHRDWDRHWTIFTEHFEIRTNVPLSEAIAFSRQLEAFHDLFHALLADVIAANLPLAQRFQNKTMVGEKSTEAHLVCYFATKDEFVAHLVPIQGPGVEDCLGLYVPPRKGKGKRAPAYFFKDVGGQLDATATLYHEVSHQLLFESGGTDGHDKNEGNYWVFEGLGTYFETLMAEPDGSLQVGGLVGPRIKKARERLLQDHEFVPIADLVQLGESGFTQREVIYLHYAESMALTVFLMQSQGGKYRERFLDYVKDAYRGRLRRDSGRSLEERLDEPYQALNARFLDYLGGGPAAEQNSRNGPLAPAPR